MTGRVTLSTLADEVVAPGWCEMAWAESRTAAIASETSSVHIAGTRRPSSFRIRVIINN